MSGYSVVVRTMLAKVVLLIAVLLMPLGMSPAAASLASHDKAAGMAVGHCDGQAPKHHPKSGFAECAMACSSALPAVGAAPDEPPLIASAPVPAAAAAVLRGLHPDTATPPPKRT